MLIEILTPALSTPEGNLVKTYKSILLGILAFLTLIGPVNAAYAIDLVQPSVTVTGEAKLKIAPDQAVVPVTIVTEGETLAKAKENGDQKLKKITKTAKSYNVKDEDIKSVNNSIQTEYGTSKETSIEVDVYTGVVDFTFNVTDLPRDKTNAFVAEAQKIGFEKIVTKHSGLGTSISASFSVSDENAEIMKGKLKAKENEIFNLATETGLTRDKINSYESLQTGKRSHVSQPARHITKYKATMVVNVAVPAKDIPDFIKKLAAEGIDNIGSITFNLSSEKEYKNQVLVTALKDAAEKAHQLADATGMAVDRVTAITETTAQPIQVQDALPSGTIEIQQTVNATFSLKQK